MLHLWSTMIISLSLIEGAYHFRTAHFFCLLWFFVFQLTNTLRHGSHRAKCTPCTGVVENHNDQTQQQRCQHEAIKSKAELRHPVGDRTGCISPVPRHTECPEQINGLPQRRSTLTAPSEQVFSHTPQGKSFFCDEVTLIKSGVHSASDFSPLEYRQISVKSLLFCVQNQDCSEKKSRESPDPPVISRRFREIWKFVPPQSYRARLNKQKG